MTNKRIRENVARASDGERISPRRKAEAGFSLIELIIAMALSLVILGIAVIAFSSTLGTRTRETSKTDAITSVQAALNIMSREIGNSGYGLTTNGIVLDDSGGKQLRFRTNVSNEDAETSDPGEDVTFYWDDESQSVVRYDASGGVTSGIINRISDVDFVYYNYTYNPATQTVSVATGSPALNTGRVKITLTVLLEDVQGQPTGQEVTVSSDVTLRNSPYMLGQY